MSSLHLIDEDYTVRSGMVRQISGDYGGQNMKDYFSAIDAVKTEPFIDENRLGAIGQVMEVFLFIGWPGIIKNDSRHLSLMPEYSI